MRKFVGLSNRRWLRGIDMTRSKFAVVLFVLIAFWVCLYWVASVMLQGYEPEPVDPRVEIKAYLGVELPESAENLICEHKAVFVAVMRVRFDLPEDELQDFLDNGERLPSVSQLAKTDDLLRLMEMRESAPEYVPAWWKNQELVTPLYARKRGVRQGATSKWLWTTNVCTSSLGNGLVRIYILFTEDTWGENMPVPE